MTSADVSTIPEEISTEQFQAILKRYKGLVKSISKPAKKGEETLEELDKFRYEEAPKKYCQPDPEKKDQRLVIPLEAKDLQRLVAWKLKHGKFRPQLMKLATSNTESTVTEITKEAYTLYEADPSNIKGAIKKLSELKGIGPATASLLLSIHDPENVLFFGDEVFWWLCRNGHKESIKYTPKEYEELMERFGKVRKWLSEGLDSVPTLDPVPALDFERVGYVLMREGNGEAESSKAESSKAEGGKAGKIEKPIVAKKIENEEKEEKRSVEEKAPVTKANEKKKRKAPVEETAEVGPRRSKRGKT